ncbi:MAG: dihydrolipoyllysine-residue acetyltransferase [Alcanivorax sp.]|nr:dihydrolipoyllysine-residue acetyltransferase [Alcanivorax sp.]
MSVEIIKVPDTGGSDPVDVIEVSVKTGDSIVPEDTIVVLESDKATVEVPAPLGGKVGKLLVSVGDRVKEGDPLVEVETGDSQSDKPDAEKKGSGKVSSAESTSKDSAKDTAKKKSKDAAEQKPAAAKKSTGKSTSEEQIRVPDLGDISDAELIELLVKEGDELEAEQVLGVLESDKASLEIPAPKAGRVVSLTAKIGDKLSTGDVLMTISVSGESSADAEDESESNATSADAASEKQSTSPSSAEQSSPGQSQQPAAQKKADQGATLTKPSGPVHAGPAVRKLARELGADLGQITGTGPRARILKEDVHAHVKTLLTERPTAAAAAGVELPQIDFSKFGPTEQVELNKLRRVSAANLHRSWITVPHVTQFDEADITDLEAFRQAENARLAKMAKATGKDAGKLTMLAFLVKASAVALREFPNFNSSLALSGDALIYKQYINIGVAVDTPNGLVVPVIRDADQKGILAVAREMGELAEKARNRKLAPGDMQGGSFSISSLGGIGGTAFTPIVNWPEVAILGVSRTQKKPVWDGEAFQPRDMLPLSLSYDHRVIDGADAARFTSYLCEVLTDLRRALL